MVNEGFAWQRERERERRGKPNRDKGGRDVVEAGVVASAAVVKKHLWWNWQKLAYPAPHVCPYLRFLDHQNKEGK